MNKVEGKALAVIDGTSDEDIYGPNGGFTAILSTPSMDRDGDRLEREEWIEPFQKRYVLDLDHGMSVADTIGSYEPFWDGDQIKMRAFFASTAKAQEARTLVQEGHIRSVSVAFMTDKSKKSGEPRREMLNAGLVAVPSNRDAIIEDFKGVEKAVATSASTAQSAADSAVEAVTATVKVASVAIAHFEAAQEALRESEARLLESKAPSGGSHSPGMGGDAALLQAAHDALCHLGAVCFPLVDPNADPTGASDGANKSVDEAEEKAVDLAAVEAVMEEFKSSLTAILTPAVPVEPAVEDLPAESPADPPAESAAATDEVPAPDEAAEEAAEEVDPQVTATELYARLFVAHNS